MTKAPFQGFLTLVLLIGTGALSSVPREPLGTVLAALAVLYLESKSLTLDGSVTLSPATPVYLAMALIPSIGGLPACLLLLLCCLARRRSPLLQVLGQARSLAGALFLNAALIPLFPETPWLGYFLTPPAYLILKEIGLRYPDIPSQTTEKELWYRYHLSLRPLELGFAFGAPLLALAYQTTPWALVAAIPLFLTARVGAESVLSLTQSRMIGKLERELMEEKSKQNQTREKISLLEREKTLLKNFSELLLSKPDLQTIWEKLHSTASELVNFDNSALFLLTEGEPQPFFYEATPEHSKRLRGAILTGLVEPVVLRADREKRPVHQRKPPEANEPRLFTHDLVAAAIPLPGVGVLYLGREQANPFRSEELDLLKRLASQAKRALLRAFEEQRTVRRERGLEREVQNLEERLAWTGGMVRAAETVSSTLDKKQLLQNFIGILGEHFPHNGGGIVLDAEEPVIWGEPTPRVEPEVLARLRLLPGPLCLYDLVNTPYSQFAEGGYSSLLASGLGQENEPSGAIFLLSLSKGAFKPIQGNQLRLLGAQLCMSWANATLFQEVVQARERVETSQMQLVQSSKMAALGQMAAGLAHELNTPLGCMSISLESLRINHDEQVIDAALTAAERARDIIDNLLHYSREGEARRQKFDLNQVVKDTVAVLRYHFSSSEVSLELRLEESLPLLEGFPGQIQQVVTNLLINGRDAVVESGGTVVLETFEESGEAVLVVSDDGSGVPAGVADRIFDPFFTTKEVGRGTGLGLSVSQQIAIKHQGSLRLENPGEGGARFVLRLPLAIPDD